MLAETQGAMQEACMCKQLMEKQTPNNLTLEVYGKLKSSQATISQIFEIRSKMTTSIQAQVFILVLLNLL